MNRTLILLAAVLCVSSPILASCGGRSSLPTEPIVQPRPPAVDPRLCLPAEPEPPVEGSIILPVTPAEIAAVRDHLTSDQAAREWGREGWERAGIAREACPPPGPR